MMKKLLALVMVLGFASLASAGLFLEGGEAPLTVMGDDTEFNAYTQFVIVTDAAITDWTVNYQGAGSGVTDFSGTAAYVDAFAGQLSGANVTGVFKIDVKDTDPAVIDVANGNVIDFGFTGTGMAYLASGKGVVDLESGVALVPEPATMALLGLGALVLRRKK